MKKSILKIAAPTLALGLVFAPMANAAPQDGSQTVLSVKVDSKTSVSFKLSAKEKDAIKKLASVTKNLSKVETSVKSLSTATTNFYTKAYYTSVSAKVEANFYASTAGKLKANSNQLKALKKQVDHVSKKYKKSDAVTAAYKKIAELNKAITAASKNLAELHSQFKSELSEQEAKERFAAITANLSKVEVSIAELTNATAAFYTKAATDATITAKVEAEFYSQTASKLKGNSNQLQTLKKQLDYVSKYYKDTVVLAAAYKKISDLDTVVSTVSKNLNDQHTQFLAKVKEQQAKDQLTSIANELTKVETGVAAIVKGTSDFYTKAANDTTITAKVESVFYTSTANMLKANSNQLQALKKKVDEVAKVSKDTTAIAAAYKKIADLNIAVSVAGKSLNDLHAQFQAKVKEQEAKAKLTSITNEVAKVEASLVALTKATTDFYAKAATDATITAKVESNFYHGTTNLLRTNSTQLLTLKKKVDYLAKNYKDTAAVAAAYKKIADLDLAITSTSKSLNDLHTQFLAKVKDQEAKAKLASITNEISKVEANVVALTKATTDFYVKASTDATITVKVEAEFYKNTSDLLLTNTRQLLEAKKQLDSYLKTYGQSADVTAAYAKFTAQNQAIAVATETLIKLHTSFKPVVPANS
jgi:putative component of toxin-antitoxin plasmid stabilization module